MKDNKFKFSRKKDIDTELTKLANDFNYFIHRNKKKELTQLLRQIEDFRAKLISNDNTKDFEIKFDWKRKFERMIKEINRKMEVIKSK